MTRLFHCLLCCGLLSRWLVQAQAQAQAQAAFVPSLSRRKAKTHLDYLYLRSFQPKPVAVGRTGEKSADTSGDGNRQKELLQEEAEQLRRKAKELMAEISEMEAAMSASRCSKVQQKNQESDAMIHHLFAGNVTGVQLAQRIDEERWSPDQLTGVVERLYERQSLSLGNASLAREPNADFQIGDVRNSAERNEAEFERLDQMLLTLLEAAGELDERHRRGTLQNTRWTGRVQIAMASRLKELRRSEEETFKRRLAASINTASNQNDGMSVEDYIQKSLGLPQDEAQTKSFNITRVMEQVAMIPMWVPSSMLPFLLVSRSQFEPDDVKRIKEEVLTGTRFYCTSSDSIPGAAIFRGNIRSPVGLVNTTMDLNETAVIFDHIQLRLEKAGLSERIQLFFWNDPEWRPARDQREPRPKPVIMAFPKTMVPEAAAVPGLASRLLTGTSVVLTIFTTFAYALSCYALNPVVFDAVMNQKDIAVAFACIPIFLGVIAVQILHEAAHYFVAKRLRLKIGKPVPLPSLQLGSFGSITPLRSFPLNRSSLLDFALSGPAVGMVASVVLIIGGIWATVHASSEALLHFPVFPVALLKSSYLVGSLLSILAPKTMLMPLAQPIPIHPLFSVGFATLISNALNMLPIGRLDGGRAYTAVFGSRIAVLASLATLTLMSLLAVTGMSSLAIFWGLLVVALQRQPEIPLRNEVTEVNDLRVGLYGACLALAILALAPFPGGQGFL